MPRGRKKKIKEEKPKIKLKTKVDVCDKNGNFVRTYDEESHGKDFKKFADEYAKKIGGKIK